MAGELSLGDYFDELQDIALSGNQVASRLLSDMHCLGLGVEANPVLTWTWIRWAKERCKPVDDPAEIAEVEAAFIFYEIWVSEAARRQGERVFEALLKPLPRTMRERPMPRVRFKRRRSTGSGGRRSPRELRRHRRRPRPVRQARGPAADARLSRDDARVAASRPQGDLRRRLHRPRAEAGRDAEARARHGRYRRGDGGHGEPRFNAIAWATRDPEHPTKYLRSHDRPGNRKQHQAFLAEVAGKPLHAESSTGSRPCRCGWTWA